MDIRKVLSEEDERKLLAKVTQEYGAADEYTRNWKNSVMNVKDDYLVPKPKQDKVKVKKVLNLMKMKRSVFKTDDETVINVPQNGQLGSSTAENTDRVFKANYKTMQLRMKKGRAQDDDTLYGVGCLAVDGWNDYSQEPIVSYIDSRLTFPDPSNSEGNNMRFFGTLLKKTIYELEADDAYDKERVMSVRMERNEELEKISRENGNQYGDVGDDLVSIYNHITIFKSSKDKEYKKYLTTWNAGINKLLRIVEMTALSEEEKADPSKITLGVTLYRGVPIPGQYNGASAIDEVGPYQDLETLITNLQVEQALRNVVGGKTIIDGELGVDENDYATMSPGEVIIANRTTGSQTTVQNGIYKESPEPVSNSVDNVSAKLERLAQEATLQNSLAQGQSLSGSQTKAEVQTIQQNTNQILSGIASEYMESSVNLWTDIYRSYERNMSPQRVKRLTLVTDAGKPDSYGLKKHEFISKGDLYILIKSKSQEDIQDKKDFAIMLSLDASVASTFAPDSVEFKNWKRTLINKSGIKGLDGEDVYSLTADERKAYDQLSLLNLNIELKEFPEQGEPHEVYIKIFKDGVPTEARDKAIELRQEFLLATPKTTEQTTQTGNGGGGIGASMIASDNAQNGGQVSLSDVAV